MKLQPKADRSDWLPLFLLAYGAASLLHYSHNAAFLDGYPNMPAWLSPGRIYAAWVAVTTVGLVGYLLLHRGYAMAGLGFMAVYAALGFDGLGHYALGPASEHTAAMNLTIGLEAGTAALLLIAIATRSIRRG